MMYCPFPSREFEISNFQDFGILEMEEFFLMSYVSRICMLIRTIQKSIFFFLKQLVFIKSILEAFKGKYREYTFR